MIIFALFCLGPSKYHTLAYVDRRTNRGAPIIFLNILSYVVPNLEYKGISGEKPLPVSWLDEKLSLLYCPGRGANPRPPAHPDFITSKESHTLLVRP